jgi:hypothetical protein
MQNITPETAQKLKEAGFPQPEFDMGQFWYDSDGNPWVVGMEVRSKLEHMESKLVVRDLFSSSWEWLRDTNGFIFAPTAMDIMKDLGQKYVLWYDDSPKVQMWFCAKTSDSPSDTQHPFSHPNPAESAAMALLNKKSK